jgi:endonuclease YncB( thermonuclease family)
VIREIREIGEDQIDLINIIDLNFKNRYSNNGGKKIAVQESKKLIERFKKVGLLGGMMSGLLVGLLLGGGGVRAIDNTLYQDKIVFPKHIQKYEVIDGDTFIIDNGLSVRLLGIDAPNRGENNYIEATERLEELLKTDSVVWLEYDRYQIDQFGRILAWVWANCEDPSFLPANYMEKSKNASNPGLVDNPKGCKKGKLVNEEMVKAGMAKPVVYGDRGEMKYQKRISKYNF